MIPPDLLEQWRGYEISQRVIKAMQEEKDALTESMQLGHFVNPSSMEQSFGESSHAVGKMEAFNTFFNIIMGGVRDED